MAGETQDRPEQRSIQSIEVGFRLIRVLEQAGGKLPLKALSSRAEMPPGKAHLYLVSFMRVGLVVQDPETMHYGLGPYAMQLGMAALQQISLPELAREPLERMNQDYELPAYLSIWGRMGPFIAVKLDADLPTPFTIKVGFVFPLLSTATGNIFLSHMPARDTDALVEREGHLAPDLLARRDAISSKIRKDGFAVSEGHLFRGFSAVAAPVFDHTDSLAGSVTLLGIGAEIDRSPRGPVVSRVRQVAHELSGKLGSKRQ
ncbi:MAG: IclR family transcriptional regulator [Hyphomicrobiaceae bacterium]